MHAIRQTHAVDSYLRMPALRPMARLTRDWRALDPEQRLAAGAAVALFVTMLLPWYQQNAVINAPRASPLQSRNLNAFQVFSFVEAAVLLVAVAVAYLLYARAEGQEFHLPGGDGSVVLAAGLWTAVLLIFRLFDKPGISSHGVAGNVGVQWGIFFALAAAGLLAYSGSRMRAAQTPQPPRSRGRSRSDARDTTAEPDDTPAERDARERFTAHPPGSAREQDHEGADPTRLLPARARSAATDSPPDSPPGDEPAAGGRPRYPPAPAEQMSFEDQPPGSR